MRGDLAREAPLGVNTIRRAEVADLGTSLTVANELAIRRAFEAAGVEFTNGDQPGVRLAKAAATHSAESASASNRTVAANAPRRLWRLSPSTLRLTPHHALPILTVDYDLFSLRCRSS
jgi:hypothetical protein